MIVSVSYDDDTEDVREFMKENGYDFPVLMDNRQNGITGPLYQVGPIPTLFLIDRDRKITYKHIGYEPGDEEELKAKIDQALGRAA